jgi:hypothetical protein
MVSMMDYNPEPPRFYFGLDLGQVNDWSSLVVVERDGQSKEPPPEWYRCEMKPFDAREALCSVRAIKRFDLGLSYLAVVDSVSQNFSRAPKGAHLMIDGTGVGRAVVDMFLAHPLLAQHRSRIHPITITAGHTVNYEDGYYRVPKRDLVSVVQARLQSGLLKIANSLPETQTLVGELRNFKAKITAAANVTFGAGDDWRVNNHDDILLALSMALWGAESKEINGAEWRVTEWYR